MIGVKPSLLLIIRMRREKNIVSFMHLWGKRGFPPRNLMSLFLKGLIMPKRRINLVISQALFSNGIYGLSSSMRIILYLRSVSTGPHSTERHIFWGARFNEEVSLFRGIFINEVYFYSLRIKEKIRFESIDLKKAAFLGTDLRKIDFVNCTWPKKIGRDVLYDEISIFGNDREPNPRFKGGFSQILKQEWDGFKKKYAPEKEMIKRVEILYQMLKQKYKEEHNEYEVSVWHYGEKEMFRKGSYFRRFFPLSLSNLYWLSSGYGERPVRAGIGLIFLMLGISVLMAMSGLKHPEGSFVVPISRIDGFAAIILNTLQYATLQKATLLEPASLTGGYLKLLTQILIPLQTALFALAIKNRFKR